MGYNDCIPDDSLLVPHTLEHSLVAGRRCPRVGLEKMLFAGLPLGCHRLLGYMGQLVVVTSGDRLALVLELQVVYVLPHQKLFIGSLHDRTCQRAGGIAENVREAWNYFIAFDALDGG